jgi:3-deoxy-manno-octulosonate cytidylyltransferase (CMP-KDO synthetase)|tara:strand:- start:1093 stop:1824 length:732 start_codon:yes stop_codon:yes gene_type:complete
MTVSALIPARLNSSRLEKKLIKDLDGIPIIVRTYKNIVSTNLFKEVIVVTDADEIVEILKKHNIKFLKSLKSHNTGTDRIAEFADKFNSDIIVNVQGDEPFISKDDLIKIINEFKCDSNNLVNVVSLMIKLSNIDEINNPNNVKVVVDNNNDSILFSRSIIPFDRDDLKPNYYKHIGVYAFRTLYLKKFAKYDQTPLEKAEMIEALRIVEHGEKIRMIEIFKEHVSIDTIDDLKMAESILKQK